MFLFGRENTSVHFIIIGTKNIILYQKHNFLVYVSNIVDGFIAQNIVFHDTSE